MRNRWRLLRFPRFIYQRGSVRADAAKALGARYAREYMHTRTFVLGGLGPAELLTHVGGEAAVLNELHASLNGGPI